MKIFQKIRLLLADDHPYLSDGVEAALSDSSTEVVGKVQLLSELEDAIDTLKPDIVLIDILFKENQNGIEFIREFIAKHGTTKTKFIAFSQFDEISFIKNAYEAGARSFLPKNVEIEELRIAIKSVHASDKLYTAPEIAQIVAADTLHGSSDQHPKEQLTERQYDIFKHLALGKTQEQIAKETGLSLRTTKNEIPLIKKALALSTVAEMAIIAYHHGIIDPLDLRR